MAEDLCRHLATLYRQYNDYGSVARDRAEGNLNNIDFPQFGGGPDYADGTGGGEAAKKSDLLWLAEYERECLDAAAVKLRDQIPAEIMDAIDLFARVTDLYGQIYVARDIASRMK